MVKDFFTKEELKPLMFRFINAAADLKPYPFLLFLSGLSCWAAKVHWKRGVKIFNFAMLLFKF